MPTRTPTRTATTTRFTRTVPRERARTASSRQPRDGGRRHPQWPPAPAFVSALRQGSSPPRADALGRRPSGARPGRSRDRQPSTHGVGHAGGRARPVHGSDGDGERSHAAPRHWGAAGARTDVVPTVGPGGFAKVKRPLSSVCRRGPSRNARCAREPVSRRAGATRGPPGRTGPTPGTRGVARVPAGREEELDPVGLTSSAFGIPEPRGPGPGRPARDRGGRIRRTRVRAARPPARRPSRPPPPGAHRDGRPGRGGSGRRAV
jgi:hypothetical protein